MNTFMEKTIRWLDGRHVSGANNSVALRSHDKWSNHPFNKPSFEDIFPILNKSHHFTGFTCSVVLLQVFRTKIV